MTISGGRRSRSDGERTSRWVARKLQLTPEQQEKPSPASKLSSKIWLSAPKVYCIIVLSLNCVHFPHILSKEGHLRSDLLFNADETLLNVTSNSELKCLKMLDPIRKAHQSKRLNLNTVGSMTPFVTAAGEVYLIAYCLKAPQGKPIEFYLDNVENNRKVAPLALSPFLTWLAPQKWQHCHFLLLFWNRIS